MSQDWIAGFAWGAATFLVIWWVLFFAILATARVW